MAEAQRKGEERLNKLEETVALLVKAQKRIDERLAELAEAQKRTEESIARLSKAQEETRIEVEKLRITVGSIGNRLGHDYERLIRVFFKDFASQEGLNFRYVNRLTYKDDTGKYGRKGGIYEIDILAKNGRTYLIEAKSFPEPDDVDWFSHKTDVIVDALGLKGEIVKLLLAIHVTKDVVDRANELGIKLLYDKLIEE